MPIPHSGVLREQLPACSATRRRRAANARPSVQFPGLRQKSSCRLPHKGSAIMTSDDRNNRTHLPMPNTARRGLITYDAKARDTKSPPIEQLRPPKGAPNVLLILIDDAGFGSASAFGGPCQTPNAEKLAANGLKYNRFHNTALSSPTRQALLTGRNHHTAGMGGITEIASGSPGYSSVLPNTISPLARTLKLNGYSTAQFGKCHEVRGWETSPAGRSAP